VKLSIGRTVNVRLIPGSRLRPLEAIRFAYPDSPVIPYFTSAVRIADRSTAEQGRFARTTVAIAAAASRQARSS